jgi:antitoxin CcdA
MTTRKGFKLTMDAELLAKAKAEGLNLSAELEQGIRAKLTMIEAERWKRENAEALSVMVDRIDAQGVTGKKHLTYG